MLIRAGTCLPADPAPPHPHNRINGKRDKVIDFQLFGKNLLSSSGVELICCGSVAKLCLTLWPHGLQHARLLCTPLSHGVCSDSCPLSWWCCLTISCSAVPFSFCLQSFLESVFSNESALHIRCPKYWSFRINPSNGYSGFISFRVEWFDLLAVQGTLKSLL